MGLQGWGTWTVDTTQRRVPPGLWESQERGTHSRGRKNMRIFSCLIQIIEVFLWDYREQFKGSVVKSVDFSDFSLCSICTFPILKRIFFFFWLKSSTISSFIKLGNLHVVETSNKLNSQIPVASSCPGFSPAVSYPGYRLHFPSLLHSFRVAMRLTRVCSLW